MWMEIQNTPNFPKLQSFGCIACKTVCTQALDANLRSAFDLKSLITRFDTLIIGDPADHDGAYLYMHLMVCKHIFLFVVQRFTGTSRALVMHGAEAHIYQMIWMNNTFPDILFNAGNKLLTVTLDLQHNKNLNRKASSLCMSLLSIERKNLRLPLYWSMLQTTEISDKIFCGLNNVGNHAWSIGRKHKSFLLLQLLCTSKNIHSRKL